MDDRSLKTASLKNEWMGSTHSCLVVPVDSLATFSRVLLMSGKRQQDQRQQQLLNNWLLGLPQYILGAKIPNGSRTSLLQTHCCTFLFKKKTFLVWYNTILHLQGTFFHKTCLWS